MYKREPETVPVPSVLNRYDWQDWVNLLSQARNKITISVIQSKSATPCRQSWPGKRELQRGLLVGGGLGSWEKLDIISLTIRSRRRSTMTAT